VIEVFVGTAPKFAAVEPVMAQCLADNASEPVSVNLMRLQPSGCTGFTMSRYAVPSLAGRAGYAIYLDVDMFVLGDIAELWAYRRQGAWACLKDGSTEVMVIDCAAGNMPHHDSIHKYKKGQLTPPLAPVIPMEWNHEDHLDETTKLLHFTDLSMQPWFYDHHPLKEVWDGLKALYA